MRGASEQWERKGCWLLPVKRMRPKDLVKNYCQKTMLAMRLLALLLTPFLVADGALPRMAFTTSFDVEVVQHSNSCCARLACSNSRDQRS